MSDLVTVATFASASEAAVAQMLLREAGIQAFVSDAELVTMDWFYANAVGYIKVQVRDEQAAAARAALRDWRTQRRANDRERDDSEEDSAARCLVCGEPLPADRSDCPACGWSYAGEPENGSSRSAAEECGEQCGEQCGEEHGDDGAAVREPDAAADDFADEEAAAAAETNATNLRLLIGIVLFGLLAISILPRLRDFVQGRL